ncbi:MAG TPA: YqaJ viral recombinase family protein [Caldisericia bacterium]|nr:YqaJ viral recombinase family protein [Caldisericia bacterium]
MSNTRYGRIKIQTEHGELKECAVIGPSNLAAIMGEDPYTTPLQLFNRLTARSPREQSEFAQCGIDLEPYLAKVYERDALPKGITFKASTPFRKHPQYDWFGCYSDGELYFEGSLNATLNIKVFFSDFGVEGYDDPEDWVKKAKRPWYWQAQGEMAITGTAYHIIYPWCAPNHSYDEFLKAMISSKLLDNETVSKEFFGKLPPMPPIIIKRCQEDINLIYIKGKEFWDMIVADTPPMEPSVKPQSPALGSGLHILKDSGLVDTIKWYMAQKGQVETAKKDIEAALFGVKESVIFADGVYVTKAVNEPKKRLDMDRVIAKLPRGTVLDDCYVLDNVEKPFTYKFSDTPPKPKKEKKA